MVSSAIFPLLNSFINLQGGRVGKWENIHMKMNGLTSQCLILDTGDTLLWASLSSIAAIALFSCCALKCQVFFLTGLSKSKCIHWKKIYTALYS